jgi:peptidoglycan/LPS O-acetylase OafA/YrhL
MTSNNLSVLRLFAASMVLYGHSFIFLGQQEPLFLSWLPLGPLGVFIFFVISGYLISESWDRDPHLLRFFQRRLLRIIPGLTICILLTIFFFGPIFTTLPLKTYFIDKHTYGYLQNIVLHIVYYLPGVFEHNRVANAVNGSLWSLPVEFLMYIVVAAIGVMSGNRWVFAALAVISAATCLLWAQVSKEMVVIYNFDLRQGFLCGTYFWVGACVYKFKIRPYLTLPVGMLSIFIMLCLEPWTDLLANASWILLPIVVLTFGFAYSPWLSRLTVRGDYSYGIYIYSFPIQQAVVYIEPQIEIRAYLLLCMSLTLICAIASWHWVERPAMSLKPRHRGSAMT